MTELGRDTSDLLDVSMSKSVEDRIADLENVVNGLARRSEPNAQVKKKLVAMQNAVDEMKKSIDGLRKEMQLSVKMMSQNQQGSFQINQQMLSHLGDIETRLEAQKRCLVSLGITEDGYEDTWNDVKGLRKKADDEVIEKGDMVMIDFIIKDKADGKVLVEHDLFPYRAGTNALVIEDKFVGRKVGDCKSIDFEMEVEKDKQPWGGKTIVGVVKVLRVKTKVEQGEEK